MVKRINTSRFGTQSVMPLHPKIWNNLPSSIKLETSFLKFKNALKLGIDRSKVCINMQGMHKHVNKKPTLDVPGRPDSTRTAIQVGE